MLPTKKVHKYSIQKEEFDVFGSIILWGLRPRTLAQ